MFNDFYFIIKFKIIVIIIIFIDMNRKVFQNRITFEWKFYFIISFIFNIYSKKFIEIQKLNFWITLVQFRIFWSRFSQNVLLFEKHFFISTKIYVFNNTKLPKNVIQKRKNYFRTISRNFRYISCIFVGNFWFEKHIFPKKVFVFPRFLEIFISCFWIKIF